MNEHEIEHLRRLLLEIRQRVEQALVLIEEPEAEEIFIGTMSIFGGPEDYGVDEDEGLALIEPSEVDEFDEELFLPEQPEGTTGLARRLNPEYPYIAMRWNYDVTSRDWLQTHTVSVRNPLNGRTVRNVQPVDWGPHEDTGRVADLSPGLASALNLQTDDECEVKVPVPTPVA